MSETITAQRRALSFRLRPALAVAAAAALVVAGVAGLLARGPGAWREPPTAAPAAPRGLSGTIARVARASTDGRSGLELRAPGAGGFVPASAGATIAAGTTLRTDGRTRARVDLSDGSTLVLNHETELTLDASAARGLRLAGGEVLAEVSPLEAGPALRLHTPTGQVEVLDTKLVLTATPDLASVRVTRGLARVHGDGGAQADVKAGEEGLITRQGEVSVSPDPDLAADVGWAELEVVGGDADLPVAGLGQLRARRPGEDRERERSLSLASHTVRVRIVGNVAHTEVEEVFRNEAAVTLEGIYRFPLPPDAQIARLALDVDGRMEEGAFVERDVGSKIWQGVIRRAAQRAARPVETPREFIWVPGPWRDPALLEWQRGGQFQLRVFPIEARSERRVIIGYTQTIRPHGSLRRYVYPLAHSADASTRVGRFELDLRVAGADPAVPVRAHGYEAQAAPDGDATRLTMARTDFLPAGDLVVDYALPDERSEIRWWTFAGPGPAAAPAPSTGPGAARSSPEVLAAHDELARDGRAYVAFAIRPELPARAVGSRQDLVLVVDASQSMVGERYARAVALASGIVAEMDRRDRFVVMACDAECATLPGGLQAPTARAASEVSAWLSGLRPAGASDLAAVLQRASREVAGLAGGKPGVIYIGDGVATTGHRRAGAIAALVESTSRSAGVTFTTVGVGGDADAMTLSAIARAGGGSFVPYVPGQRAGAAALAVLETTFGVALRDATVELPAGVTDVGPERLPTLRRGEELIVVGRFAGPVDGEVVLRGTVGGEPYEDRYPVRLTASTASGNAFVPRLWAAATIERLELSGLGADRPRAIAISRAFGVMSRHTSMLVLESEAMARAFGVERIDHGAGWTGEEAMETGRSTGTATHVAGTETVASLGADEEDAPGLLAGGLGLNGAGRGGGGAGEGTIGLGNVGTIGHGAGSGTGRGGGGAGEGTIGLGNAGTIGRGAGRGTGSGYGRGVGGPRGRHSSTPTVRSGAADVRGSLDREVIRRSIGRRINEIRFCYERELARRPDLEGRVDVQFVIGPTGAVTSSRTTGSTLGAPAVEACVVQALQRAAFPPPGGAVIVTYPFVFRVAEGGATWAPPPPPRQIRVATIRGPAARSGAPRAVEEAEAALRASPDSRDRHRALVRALSRAGELERALEVVEQWIARDRLDAEALTALADLVGRSGRRDEAVRLLSGAVDLEPESRPLHERLAAAFERAGDGARACSHRIALAELAADDAGAAAAAVRCARALGDAGSADQVLAGLGDAGLRARVEQAAAAPAAAAPSASGLVLDASWPGEGDLDLSLITPQGTRISWMGGRTTVTGDGASEPGRERLGLRRAPLGTYLIEISRTGAEEAGPIRGEIRIAALGERRTLPFELSDQRAVVGSVTIEQRWVP